MSELNLAPHLGQRRRLTPPRWATPPSRAPSPLSLEPTIKRGVALARAMVEHPFHAVKDVFGLRKTRYRGLKNSRNLLSVAFALADTCLLFWAGRSIAAVGRAGRVPPARALPKSKSNGYRNRKRPVTISEKS